MLSNRITLNNDEYTVKGIVCMPSELHYTCYIFNNDKNYLDLSLNKTLYHDGKKNNGFVIECDETIDEVIKNVVSYIFILVKLEYRILHLIAPPSFRNFPKNREGGN